MKNPRLPGKIILPTAFFLILAGSLGLLFDNKFPGIAVASDDQSQASFIIETAASEKQVVDLSQTSPAWRQKLSKHIFINIDQELQSLEQQFTLHNSAKGKRLIKRVRVSLQKMKSGKQKFMRTGREPSLALFYNGRTVLEYNLWKLKGLTRNLKMDQTQSRGLYRVYALMNKWLVYVAHREIDARRQGSLDASLRAETKSTQGIEEFNTAFPQISEMAKITEQDLKEAGEALSQPHSPVQKTTPNINSETFERETLKSPEPETRQDPQPNLVMEEGNTVSPPSFEEGVDSPEAATISNWIFVLVMGVGVLIVSFLIFRRKRKSTDLRTFYRGYAKNHLERHDQNTTDFVEIHTLIGSGYTEDTAADNASEVPNNGDFSLENSIFREALPQAPDHMTLQNEPSSLSSAMSETMESPTEEWSKNSEIEAPITDGETPEGIPSQVTDNGFEDPAQKDMTFQLEELTQKLENTLAENDSLKEKLETFHEINEGLESQVEALRNKRKKYAHGWVNLLKENHSLAEAQEISNKETEELDQDLESTLTEKEDRAQGLENILAENDSLTETLESTNSENETLKEQLKTLREEKEERGKQMETLRNEKKEYTQKLETLREEKEESTQGLESILAENNSLTEILESTASENETLKEQLETLHEEKEERDKQMETLSTKEEELAQKRENILAENNSLTEKLETLNEEKEGLKKQLETLHSREEELARHLESTLAENNSLTENMGTAHTKEEDRDKQLETPHAEKEERDQELENTLAENNSLMKQLKTSHQENERLKKHLETLHTEKERLAQKQNNTDAKSKTMKKTPKSTRGNNKIPAKKLKSTPTEKEALTKQFKAAQEKAKRLAKELKNSSAEREASTKKLKATEEKSKRLTKELKNTSTEKETSAKKLKATEEKIKRLAKELKNTSTKKETLTKKLKATQGKNKGLPKEPKSTSTKKEALTKKFKTSQGKNKATAKQYKALANQWKRPKPKAIKPPNQSAL